nr:ECF transporter S component [candidate division Zixibacteria bacterium]
MKAGITQITRVAIFAALVFIFSYFTSLLYNVNPSFFIVFAAGFAWGIWPGIGVGVIGFFLWSNFNPFGPAPFPLLLSQLLGISFSAIIGAFAARLPITFRRLNLNVIFILALSGLLCGLIFHLIVDIVDAYLFQPFWPRLIGGLLFSLITIVSNAIIFPLLHPVLKLMIDRGKMADQ